MTPQAAFAEATRRDEAAALVTVVRGAHAGERLLVRLGGTSEGLLGDPALHARALHEAAALLDAGRSEVRGELFVDVNVPRPRLVVVGAVDYAVALAVLARTVGWRAYVVDPRSRFADPERFPAAEAVLAAWPAQAATQLGGLEDVSAVVALSHDAKLDDAALLLALREGVPFVGAMGSRRVRAARTARLLEAGATAAELARLSAPLGLDLGASSPEETALSILAEVVAARHGRAGGRLADANGPIHDGPR